MRIVRHTLLLALFLVTLAGCSQLGSRRPETATHPGEAQPPTEQAGKPGPAQAQQTTPAAPAYTLPDVNLSSPLLYQLLVAEVASQRGDLRLSAESFLKGAKLTEDPRLARRAARMAVFARDYELALQAAQYWVTLDPDDSDAHQSAAALLIRLRRTDAAMEDLRALLRLNPGKNGLELVSGLLSREKDPQRALAAMAGLISAQEDGPDARYAYAHLAYAVGANDVALSALNTLLAEQPEMERSLILRSEVLRKLGRNDAALADLKKAVELNGDDAKLRLGYARLLVEARRLPEARIQFRLLAKQLPNNNDMVYALGLLALDAGDLEDASTHFERLFKAGEHRDEAAMSLGQIAENQGHPEQARQWYERVDGDAFLDARLRIAGIVAEQQGLAAAVDYLHSLNVDDPGQQARLLAAEGELLRQSDRLQEAMSVYQQALKRFPDDTDLLYNRAMLAESMDHIDQMEKDLHRVLELDPGNVQALNALGYVLADRTTRFEEALRYIQQAYTQRPDDPAIIDSMGWVMFKLGRLEQAERYLREANTMNPDAEIAAHLGEVLWNMGRRDDARAVWSKAQQSAGEHPVLKSTIERLEK